MQSTFCCKKVTKNKPHALANKNKFTDLKRMHSQISGNERCSSLGSCSSRKKRSSSAAIVGSNDDLLTEILIWLPAESVITFKTVSKHWLSLISDQVFTRLHDGRRLVETQHSFIQSFILKEKKVIRFSSASVKKFVPICLIPHVSTEHIRIHHCVNGLMLLRLKSPTEDRIDYVVYNPTTKQYIFIHLDWYRPLKACILFDPSKSEHYKLFMRISKDPPRYSVYDSATHHWRHDLVIGDAFGVDMSGVLPHNLIVCSSMLDGPSIKYFLTIPQRNVYCTNLVESNGYSNILQIYRSPEEKKHYFRVGAMINRKWVICKKATLDFNSLQCVGMIREERVEDSAFLFNSDRQILILRFSDSDDDKVDLEVVFDYTSDYGELTFNSFDPFYHTFASV